jgi:hypothetical protein
VSGVGMTRSIARAGGSCHPSDAGGRHDACVTPPLTVSLPDRGKRERLNEQHLTLRTRIKRLVRKTICFSRSIQMHDTVLGLVIHRYEFGLQVYLYEVQI